MNAVWGIKELNSVASIKYGYTESASSEAIGPRFLRITDIQDDHVNWSTVPYCKIGSKELPKYRLASGDIVFARTGATTGKSFLVDEPPEAVFASYLIRLRLTDQTLLPEFVSYFFQTDAYWKVIKEGSAGSAQGGFNATKLGALSIPVPPWNKQRRIVEALNEAFSGLATAQANAEENLQNARALFESHLNSIFNRYGNGWIERDFNKVCEISSVLVDPQNKKFLDMPHVGGANIESKTGRLADIKTAREEGLVSGKFLFNDSMVLYSKIRPYLMKVARPDFEGLCSADIYPLAPHAERLDRGFLFHLLLSPKFTSYANSGSARAGMPKVNREHLFAYRTQYPPLTAQREMATQLDALLLETLRLEKLYGQKLSALAELKKSLLHQAFNGEL